MNIPASVRIPICIERGSVFNFKLAVEGGDRQSKNRYFVILNRNPKTDIVLIMLTPTTQVSKKKEFVRRSGISEKTIVIISSSEYSVFNTESAFNCNDTYEVRMSDLIKKIESGGSMNYPKVSDMVLNKLVTAVKNSPVVSVAIKKLL